MAKFGSDYSGLAHHYIHNVDYSECYGNRMFSENLKMYSYGRHYLMAQRGTLKNGDNWIIIHSDAYSVTTNKQLWALRGAVPSWWKVWNFNPEYHLNIQKVFNHYYDNIVELMTKAQRARTKRDEYINDANDLLNELQSYFQTFKGKFDLRRIKKSQKQVLNADHVLSVDMSNIIELRIKEDKVYKAKLRKAKEERERKELERAKKKIEKWRNGEISHLYGVGLKDTMLRVYDGKVSSSKNMTFEIDECKTLYRCLKNGLCLKGSRITLNGSQWIIKTWNAERLVIGCHSIPVTEIEAVAKELNF